MFWIISHHTLSIDSATPLNLPAPQLVLWRPFVVISFNDEDGWADLRIGICWLYDGRGKHIRVGFTFEQGWVFAEVVPARGVGPVLKPAIHWVDRWRDVAEYVLRYLLVDHLDDATTLPLEQLPHLLKGVVVRGLIWHETLPVSDLGHSVERAPRVPYHVDAAMERNRGHYDVLGKDLMNDPPSYSVQAIVFLGVVWKVPVYVDWGLDLAFMDPQCVILEWRMVGVNALFSLVVVETDGVGHWRHYYLSVLKQICDIGVVVSKTRQEVFKQVVCRVRAYHFVAVEGPWDVDLNLSDGWGCLKVRYRYNVKYTPTMILWILKHYISSPHWTTCSIPYFSSEVSTFIINGYWFLSSWIFVLIS